MPEDIHAGVVLASRYRLEDLLAEENGGLFWRAHDRVLHRPVAVHLLPADDERAAGLLDAARRSATLVDRRLLRVLDADRQDGMTYVVNEWGQGASLDNLLDTDGPLPPRQAAWLVAEVGDTMARAHEAGLSHGRLAPENVLVDHNGQVRIIGFAVDAALHGLPESRRRTDVVDLAGLLYAALTGRWAGESASDVTPAPHEHGSVLRPRKVRAGIPRVLDTICDVVINPWTAAQPHRGPQDLTTARGLTEALQEFVGDPSGLAIERAPQGQRTTVLPTVEPGPGAPGSGAPGPTAAPTGTPPAAADAEPTLVTPVPPAPGEAGEAGDEQAGDEQVGAGEVGAGEVGAGEPARPEVADEPAGGTPEPDPEGPGDATDQPTQAGVPIFHEDTDDVSWLRKRTEKPAPPPPLEDPPERPLFAPDPPDGGPARRPRPGAATGARATSATGATGTGAGTAGVSREDTGGTGSGSWGTGSWGTGSWVSNTADTGPVEPVPGRNWFRLAVIVGICTLVLVAALAAYQLGGTGDDEADDAPDSPTASQTTPAQPIEGVTAEDFDPQGSPPQDENPDLVPLVLDDDPSTAWRTATYLQNFGPAGLKTGVGLRLDLGEAREVREVDVSVVGRTTAEVYVTEEPPETVDGLDPLGEGTSAGTVEVRPEEAVTGRYVTVWLTSLPSVDGGWRGEVSGVVVRG